MQTTYGGPTLVGEESSWGMRDSNGLAGISFFVLLSSSRQPDAGRSDLRRESGRGIHRTAPRKSAQGRATKSVLVRVQCVETSELREDMRLVILFEHLIDRRHFVHSGMIKVRWRVPLTVVWSTALVRRHRRFHTELPTVVSAINESHTGRTKRLMAACLSASSIELL